jgi:hypothetical protein
MNYGFLKELLEGYVGAAPTTSNLRDWRSAVELIAHFIGQPGGTRTHIRRLKRPMLDQFSYRLLIWWTDSDSNREPSPCKGVALPLELPAHGAETEN